MGARGRFRRVAREWVAAALGLAAVAAAGVVYYRESGRAAYRLTVSAGSDRGQRYQIAQRLKAAAAARQVALTLVPASGSEEALEMVESGALDLALVQGGLDPSGRGRVRQAAALRVEPLHLLVKSELAPAGADGEARGLEFLRGRRVNLSEVGSGTYDLAREVLSFAGLGPDGDYEPTTRSYRALLEEPDRTRLPDAVFTVSALPSPVARHLLTRRDFRLVPLRFGKAFALDTRHDAGAGARAAPPEARTPYGVDRAHVTDTEIPAYTYGVSPPTPPRAVPTFGTRLLLVARDDAPAEAVRRVLDAVYTGARGGLALDPALLETDPELDWHDGTLAYRDRIKPVVIGDAIDFLEKTTSLLGGVLGGSFFLWQWYRHRTRRRQEAGFESYMLKVAAIERRALELETGAALDLKELVRLQVEVSRLKSEALQRLADGDLDGEELISGFVTHVNDARDYLTRLILHERDNLEEKAALQRRPAETIWFEEVGEVDGPSAHPAGDGVAADAVGP